MENWYSVRTPLLLEGGIHARPVLRITDIAESYPGRVFIINLYSGDEADAKSAMDLILFPADEGCELEVRAERGDGCENVALQLAGFLSSGARYPVE